jgi:hypothetical protein
MAALKTERLSAREGEASGLFAYLTSGEKGGDPVRAIWTTLAVFLAGLVIEWGFRPANPAGP